MTDITSPEWRESQQDTRYPFADGATLQGDSDTFIPEALFIAATFYPIGGRAGLRLSKIVVTFEGGTFYIGDDETEELAYAQFSWLSVPSSIRFVDAYGRAAGMAVVDPVWLGSLQSWPTGTYTFARTQTEFAASCCLPTPEPGVRGFLLDDGSVVSGDVYLVGADGVTLEYGTAQAAPGQGCSPAALSDTEKLVRINVMGDPLFKRRECGTVFPDRRFLESVTVEAGTCRIECGPDSRGDFQLTGGSYDTPNPVLRVKRQPGKNAVLIEAAGSQLGT